MKKGSHMKKLFLGISVLAVLSVSLYAGENGIRKRLEISISNDISFLKNKYEDGKNKWEL
jgi:hypothetical protein